LEVFDSTLVALRMDPRHYEKLQNDPELAGRLLTNEQRKNFILFALDPDKKNDRREFFNKA
jgi:hypothetical protein